MQLYFPITLRLLGSVHVHFVCEFQYSKQVAWLKIKLRGYLIRTGLE